MPKKSGKGVLYAENETEAKDLMLEYTKSIDLDRALVSDSTWATTLRIACDPKEGIAVAEATLLTDLQELRSETNKTARRDAIATQWGTLSGRTATIGGAVQNIASQCRAQYIAGSPVDFSYGATMTETAFEALGASWKTLGTWASGQGLTQFQSFRWLPVENKEEKGKGSVGATLARRGRQGNLFVSIRGITYNVHIDIS
ncbi:hypothetical protein ABCR94_12215 [Streptomyces sp. 21So2-11]|uniref:hypothetical protein n=1 Tax=Streptomyces sp. 21So2-11 TaxID=3144408 RepID=UPI00321AF333